MIAYLLVLLTDGSTAALGCAITLLAQYTWRHRARIGAEYRALAALRGCRHARPVSVPQPWHVLRTPGHRKPGHHGRHESGAYPIVTDAQTAVAA